MTVDDRPRLARVSDLPDLAQVVSAAYAKYRGRMESPPAPVLEDPRPHVEAGEMWVLGDPVTALLCLVPEEDALLIENIAVLPDAQGTGLGRRLVEHARGEALRLHLPVLRLYTNEVMTENVSLYEHLGFREVDRRSDGGYRRVFMERPVTPSPGHGISSGDGTPRRAPSPTG